MLKEHGNMTFTEDIMYISKIPFIIMTSREIHFSMVQIINDNRRVTIMKSLQQVINIYHSRGFKV